MSQTKNNQAIERIKETLEKDDNVVFAVLFGSYAIGKQKRDSDIDIAVYLRKLPDADTFLGYVSKLTDVAKKEVDLIVLNNASAMLRHQVFKNKKTLFVKDPKIYVNFRVKSMNDYEEYKHINGLDIYDQD